MRWIVETQRFRLREIVPDDAPFFFALNADPEVVRYTGDGPFVSVEAAREFIENYRDYRDHGVGRWAIVDREDGGLHGWCGLKRRPDEVDLGYRLFRRSWGRGIATETGRACLAFGFQDLGLERIVAEAAVENAASVRVLEKLGMRRTGPAHIDALDAIGFELLRAEFG
jgi:ribosomal-protein-alanine N-acetyltransferase